MQVLNPSAIIRQERGSPIAYFMVYGWWLNTKIKFIFNNGIIIWQKNINFGKCNNDDDIANITCTSTDKDFR